MSLKGNFIFSTDSYDPNSIKAQERIRRGSSEPFQIDGPNTSKPKDFKLFLLNDANKVNLCKLLLRVWSGDGAASCIEKCKTATLIVDGTAHKFSIQDGQVNNIEIYLK